MSAVDHDRLYRLEARARADHRAAQQIMGYRYTADTVICDEARDLSGEDLEALMPGVREGHKACHEQDTA